MKLRGKLPWAVSACVALLIVAGAAWLLRRPLTPSEAPPVARPLSLQLARPGAEDGVLREEAILRDPRPLFLPTDLNSALPEPRREAGRTLFELDRAGDEPGETDAAVVRDLPPVASINGRSPASARGTDALAGPVEVGVVGLGRGGRVVEPLPARGGFLQVVSAVTGATMLAEVLPTVLGPAGGKAWEPLELFAAVDAAGLAAPLVVVSTSTVDEIDAHFRRILAQDFRVGERLPPGFFRLIVGP